MREVVLKLCLISVQRLYVEMERKSKDKRNWNIPVTPTLDDALEEAVRLDTHSTKSDFVRDAVRRRLEEMGFKARPFLEAQTT
jgi:hypothetical protein